jgi:GAF domain-containing protein
MESSPTSPITPPQSAFSSHFPRAEGPLPSLVGLRRPVPQNVTVFDESLSSQPIAAYDAKIHQSSYAKREQGSTSDLPPVKPNDFQDEFLMPSLAENERLRLTLFWYYTSVSKLLQDDEFISRLEERLALVCSFMRWDMAIVGLLSENMYTRAATVGLPLAILPRRESTCSHTINQPPGTVFMLPDMINDWRFSRSPHVRDGGLRSYAGAPLRCNTDTGEQVALGSLCIASATEQPPLSTEEQAALLRFADMVSGEIVSRAREARRRQRLIMAEMLAQTYQYKSPLDMKNYVFGIIAKLYPDASIEIQDALPNNSIFLPGHTAIKSSDLRNGLWENSELIEHLIITENHTQLTSESTVRAIVHQCQKIPITKYLILTSKNVQHVFDDVDTWFIERCATSMQDSFQESRLREALTAKEAFLRGITHQLRTRECVGHHIVSSVSC